MRRQNADSDNISDEEEVRKCYAITENAA
jgi:hypothetical protein